MKEAESILTPEEWLYYHGTDGVLYHDGREGTGELADLCFESGLTILTDTVIDDVFVPCLAARGRRIVGEDQIREYLETIREEDKKTS